MMRTVRAALRPLSALILVVAFLPLGSANPVDDETILGAANEVTGQTPCPTGAAIAGRDGPRPFVPYAEENTPSGKVHHIYLPIFWDDPSQTYTDVMILACGLVEKIEDIVDCATRTTPEQIKACLLAQIPPL